MKDPQPTQDKTWAFTHTPHLRSPQRLEKTRSGPKELGKIMTLFVSFDNSSQCIKNLRNERTFSLLQSEAIYPI